MNAFAIREFESGFTEVQTTLPGAQLDWLRSYRTQAKAQLAQQGLPGLKTEDWKYTNVRALLAESLNPATPSPVALPDVPDRHLAVMVNGCFNPELSRLNALPDGVTVNGLANVLNNAPDRIRKTFGQIATLDKHPFAALNSAFFHDGLVIEVAAGANTVDQPLTVLWLNSATPRQIAQPRLWLALAEGANLTLLEQFNGGPTSHLTNQLSEVALSDRAQLHHLQLHQGDRDRWIGAAHVRCGRDSRYHSFTGDLGGALLRRDLVVGLDGAGSECHLDGIFLAGGANSTEHLDNHIRIDHRAPGGRSRAYYKGVLGQGGRGVFNGKLIVHPEGQKTDARQVNRNLLLSQDIEIDSKPELEIYTDDVQCSHASASGELENEALFYLRSRGIGREQARALLVEAFAREISDQLPPGPLRERIETELLAHLQRMVQRMETSP